MEGVKELVAEAHRLLDLIALDAFDLEVDWSDEDSNNVVVLVGGERIGGFVCSDRDTIAEVRRRVKVQAVEWLKFIVDRLAELIRGA